MLAHFASRLGLHAFILLSDRFFLGRGGTRRSDEPETHEKALADVFEAFMGALYLDRGLGAVRSLLAQVLFPKRADLPLRRLWLHAAVARV